MAQIDWILVWNVIISGMLIVFLVLILLIKMVEMVGMIIQKRQKKTNPPAPAIAAQAPPQPAPSPAAPAPAAPITPAGQQFNGIAGQTVAAIAGAVQSYMELVAPGVQYTITGISESGAAAAAASAAAIAAYESTHLPPQPAAQPQGQVQRNERRPVWGFAGMRQNTRPY